MKNHYWNDQKPTMMLTFYISLAFCFSFQFILIILISKKLTTTEGIEAAMSNTISNTILYSKAYQTYSSILFLDHLNQFKVESDYLRNRTTRSNKYNLFHIF